MVPGQMRSPHMTCSKIIRHALLPPDFFGGRSACLIIVRQSHVRKTCPDNSVDSWTCSMIVWHLLWQQDVFCDYETHPMIARHTHHHSICSMIIGRLMITRLVLQSHGSSLYDMRSYHTSNPMILGHVHCLTLNIDHGVCLQVIDTILTGQD